MSNWKGEIIHLFVGDINISSNIFITAASKLGISIYTSIDIGSSTSNNISARIAFIVIGHLCED